MSNIVRPILPTRAATSPCIRTICRQVKVEGPINANLPWGVFQTKEHLPEIRDPSRSMAHFRPNSANQRTASVTVTSAIRASGASAPPITPRNVVPIGVPPRSQSKTMGSLKPGKRPPVPRLPSTVLKAAVLNLNNSAMPHSPSPMRFNFSSGLTGTHAGPDPRHPSTNDAIPMIRTTTLEEHSLSTRLPEGYESEMITVSVKKANTLAVVADKWFAETNSHHEWKVKFDENDVIMSTARAKFDSQSCILTIHVNRNRHGNMMKRAESCH